MKRVYLKKKTGRQLLSVVLVPDTPALSPEAPIYHQTLSYDVGTKRTVVTGVVRR